MIKNQGHSCAFNEPRVCKDCHDRACKERDELRKALETARVEIDFLRERLRDREKNQRLE